MGYSDFKMQRHESLAFNVKYNGFITDKKYNVTKKFSFWVNDSLVYVAYSYTVKYSGKNPVINHYWHAGSGNFFPVSWSYL